MNSINLTGRLTRDPELRELPGGNTVCRIRLAVDGLAPRQEAGFIDVATFGKPAQAAHRILTQGWMVAVTGRLEHRTWQADDGTNRHAYQVIGDVQFLTAPKGEQSTTKEAEPAAI